MVKAKNNIMTLNELIKELQAIVEESPERGELEIYAYTLDDVAIEEPNAILMVDNSISDRIDINIQAI